MHHEMLTIIGGGKATLFYIDRKRVSRAHFHHIETLARMNGRMDCFHTKAIELPGGKTRRWNYYYASL